MSELIWVGNTLLPRGLVWGVIGLIVVLLFVTAACYIKNDWDV